VNTDRADPRQSGDAGAHAPASVSGHVPVPALGHVLWRRHTRTALNADVQARAARELGVSIYDRHNDFVASALRRVAGRSLAGGATDARPVVIGRRVHFDPQAPDFSMPLEQPLPRARVIQQGRMIAREGESVASPQAADAPRDESHRDASTALPTHDSSASPRALTELPGIVHRAASSGTVRAAHVAVDAHRAASAERVDPGSIRQAAQTTRVMSAGPVVAGASRATGTAQASYLVHGQAADRAFATREHSEGTGNAAVGQGVKDTRAPLIAHRSSVNHAIADTVPAGATSAVRSRHAGGPASPWLPDAFRSVVMRVPMSALPIHDTTPGEPSATLPHAPGTAASRIVHAERLNDATGATNRDGTSPRPLVIALHRWLDEPRAEPSHTFGASAAQGLLHPLVKSPGTDVPAADTDPAWTQSDRIVREGSDVPLPLISSRAGSVERGAGHAPVAGSPVVSRAASAPMEANPVACRTAHAAGPTASGIEVSRNGSNTPVASRDEPSAPSVERVSSAATASGSASMEADHASWSRAEPVVSRLPHETPLVDRTAVRLTEANARSIVQLLRSGRPPSDEGDVAQMQRMNMDSATSQAADSISTPGVRGTDTRSANFATAGSVAVARVASTGAGTDGRSVRPVVAAGMPRTDIATGEFDLASSARAAHESARTQLASMHVIAHAEGSMLPPAIARAPDGATIHSAALSLATGASTRDASSPSESISSEPTHPARTIARAPDAAAFDSAGLPLATGAITSDRSPHGNGALSEPARDTGAAIHAHYSLPERTQPPSSNTIAHSVDATARLGNAVVAPVRIERKSGVPPGEQQRKSLEPALRLPVALPLVARHPEHSERAGDRVPQFLRVFASPATIAGRTPAASGNARSATVHSARRVPNGMVADRSVAAYPDGSVHTVGTALSVDRYAEQYGVVPADIHRAVPPLPGAHPSAQGMASHAPHGGSTMDDVTELAERAWQIIQDKLASERERRGFASWP